MCLNLLSFIYQRLLDMASHHVSFDVMGVVAVASQVPRVWTRPGQLLPVADAIGRRTVLYVLPLHEVRQQVEGRLNTITSALSPSSRSSSAAAASASLHQTKPRYKP
jgi:thiamine monophosphate kinase